MDEKTTIVNEDSLKTKNVNDSVIESDVVVEKDEEKIVEVDPEYVKTIIPKLLGTRFKFGDIIFEINYCNVGQNRFSATVTNLKKENN